MKILINTSTIKIGGGVQVAHSFLNGIRENKNHIFVIVLSSTLAEQINKNEFTKNFIFYRYDAIPNPFRIIVGVNKFLDNIVFRHKIEVVFSVFGPTYWRPNVRHIVGYAKPHNIYKESPFFSLLTTTQKFKLKLKNFFQMIDFEKNNDVLITENFDVSKRLSSILKNKDIFTVTNYYNQIFDCKKKWKNLDIPDFKGFSLLTISADYPHKNLNIIPKIVSYLVTNYKSFNFRFILTVDDSFLKDINCNEIRQKILPIGKVDINQCPYLYSISDFVFLPTLLECFTATYPEAMRMKKVILTSDLNFARGLCGNAAIYFNPLDVKEIGDKIYSLSKDVNLQNKLINNGISQLKTFDSYSDRTEKYLKIITNETNTSIF